jgi:dipeptidase
VKTKHRTRLLGGLVLSIFALAMVLPAPMRAHAPLAWEPEPEELGSCTSIMVGRLASTDGSVMTAHSCDGNYRTWLTIEPRRQHREGATKPIYWGTLHNEAPWDMRNVREQGRIPQVPETNSFFNVAYPAMNEYQLAIGETTIGGRRELRNNEGLFLIEELQKLALERARTAREAIKLIGELVAEYGYADTGECLTFADPREVWHFEIYGGGLFEIGAVWAAVRIPDDHVGVSANIPRISTLDLSNPDYYMASDNIFSLAEEMGWWDPAGGKPFRMWEAYSGRRPYSFREFYVLSTMAPELGLTMDMEELPFSVKPNRKISVQEVFSYYRETYEGHELDTMQDLTVEVRRRDPSGEMVTAREVSPAVNPWMNSDLRNLLNSLKPGSAPARRLIAVPQCSYSQVIQLRDWLPDAVGGIAWFSFDNPGQSPRIPIFAGVTSLPKSFEICGQHRFRTDSALWWFRRANRLAQVRWGRTKDILMGEVMAYEQKALTELPMIEQRAVELFEQGGRNHDDPAYREFITRYSNDFARATMQTWWEMGDSFWAMFARGF